eukprot:6010519-Pleurochrysis_carterae.AAC.2
MFKPRSLRAALRQNADGLLVQCSFALLRGARRAAPRRRGGAARRQRELFEWGCGAYEAGTSATAADSRHAGASDYLSAVVESQ